MEEITKTWLLLLTAFAVFAVPYLFSKLRPTSSVSTSPPVAKGGTIYHTYKFLQDAQQFCLALRKQYAGIVSIYLGPIRFNILSDYVSGAAQFFKRDEEFDISVFMKTFNKNVCRMNDMMNDDEKFKQSLLTATVRSLRTKPVLDDLANRYKTSVLENLEKLVPIPATKTVSTETGCEESASVVIDYVDFARKTGFKSSAESVFGTDIPALELFEYYTDFEMGVPYLLRGYPKIFNLKGVNARDNVLRLLEQYCDTPGVESSSSGIVQAHLKIFSENPIYNKADIKSRYFLAILFAAAVSVFFFLLHFISVTNICIKNYNNSQTSQTPYYG